MDIVDLLNQFSQIATNVKQALSEAKELKDLEALQVNVLGKKSPINEVLRHVKQLDANDRPKVGAQANNLRSELEILLNEAREKFMEKMLQEQLASESIDVTLPGREQKIGATHLLTRISEELEELFISMGYDVVSGPDVEIDLYNFEKMNLPKNHPARDMQDTFYITEELLLRTHTSPVQARTMEQHDFNKPLKMISPGKVYRRDSDDATHSHQFQQIEGLVIDKHITMADLKGTLQMVAKKMFGENREIRLRPSYFPFTEPSVEVDVSCFKCSGQGCSVCKQTGWIEVLGAGMVHENVLEMSGVDSKVYGGFAFGLGVERFAMLKYGVDDIRHFYQNDVRFLNQFHQVVEGENE